MVGMARFLLWGGLAATVAFVALAAGADAATWASPGGGNSYDMALLQSAAGGAVDVLSGTCHYRFDDTIIISAGDTLTIDAGCFIETDNTENLTIIGQLLVQGNNSAPVRFESFDPTPAEGNWGGITFLGAGAPPSMIENFTVTYSTFGVRCLSCQNLTVRNLYVNLSSGDAVLLRVGSWNITLDNITQVVTTYTSQSVVGATGASNLTIGAVNGSGVADLLTLWNVSNVSVTGPVVGTGVAIAGAWIDNATNVAVAGLSGSSFRNGVRVTRSSQVQLLGASFVSPLTSGILATDVDRLAVANFTLSGGAVAALALLNVSNASVSNATLSTTGVPLSINRSRAVWVNDTTLSGGSPAGVWVNGSSNVSFANVSTVGAVVGFLIQSSPWTSLRSCIATGAGTEGVRATNSSGLTLDQIRLSGNLGRGLWLIASSAVVMGLGTIENNSREGIFASASSLSLSDAVVTLNRMDGIVLTNGSALTAASLQVTSNGGEGVWLIGGFHRFDKGMVRRNGANGMRVEGASLNLTDGNFENNTRYGIFYAPNATGVWNVTAGALIAFNPAVLSGELNVTGGALTVLGSAVQFRGLGANGYVLRVGPAGVLWLDNASFARASSGDRYFLVFAGASLVALGSAFTEPGGSGRTAIQADGSSLVLSGVAFTDPWELEFSASDVSFADVKATAAQGAHFARFLNGCTAQAARLSVTGGAGSAIEMDASTLWLSEGTFTGLALRGIGATASSVTLNDTFVDGTGGDSIAIVTSWLNFTNLTLWNSASVALHVSSGSTVDGSVLRVAGQAAEGVLLEGVSQARLIDARVHGPSPFGAIQISGASSFEGTDLIIDGGVFGLAAGQIQLRNASLVPAVGAAFAVDGATLVDAVLLQVSSTSAGVSVTNAPSVALTDADIDAYDRALVIANVTLLTLTRVTAASSLSLGFEAADLGALSGSSLNATGPLGGASISRVGTLGVSGFQFASDFGAALLLTDSPSAALSMGAVNGTMASSLSASPGVRLDNLTVTGSVDFFQSAGVRLFDASVSGGGIAVENSTDFGASGLVVGAPPLSRGLELRGNSSATLVSVSVAGGNFGIYGEGGGAFLEVREALLTGQSNISLMARSYSRITLVNITADGAPTGLDLRYSAALSMDGAVVTGSLLNAITLDRCNGTVARGLTLSPAAGGGLRVVQSVGVIVEDVEVTGGSLAFNLAGSTSARLANLSVDGAGRGLSAGSASSVAVEGAVFAALGTEGIAAYNNSTVDVWNSSIVSAGPGPGFSAVNAIATTRIRLYDTTSDNASFNHSGNGSIEVYWSLTVAVQRGAAPEPGARITLFELAGLLAASRTAGPSGDAFLGYFLELRDTQGARRYASPYRAQANSSFGFSGALSFDLDRPSFVTVDVGDTQGPFLEVAAPFYRIPFGGTFTFGKRDGDADNVGIVRYEWTFVNETGAPVVVRGNLAPDFTASHRFSAAGRFRVDVAAFDAAGNRNENALFFDVWVNDPPFFLNPPNPFDTVALEGVRFQRNLAASDNDTVDRPLLTYSLQGPAGAVLQGSLLSWTPLSRGAVWLSVSVFDGYDTTSITFQLLVGILDPLNRPPEFVTEPNKNASVLSDYGYGVEVRDPDPGSNIVIQVIDGPAGMTFTQNLPLPTGLLSWRPMAYFTQGEEDLEINFSVSLRAWDGANFTYQNFTLVLKNPPNLPPTILEFGNISLGPGGVFNLDLSQLADDPDDDERSELLWSLVKPDNTQGATIRFDPANPLLLVVTAPDQIQGIHTFFITLNVSDPSGRYDTRLVRVDLVGPSVVEAAFPWLLLLVIVGGVGAAFAIATRQRAAALAESSAAPRSGSPAAGSSQAMVPAGSAGFPVYLEGVVLFDRADTLVASASAEGVDLEEEFVLVPSKAREAQAAGGTLATTKIEGFDVAILQEGDALIAAVGSFALDPSPWLEEPMKAALAQVQVRADELNADRLDAIGDDPGVKDVLRALLGIGAGSSREAVVNYGRENSVRAASVVELVQGMVRLKVAVDNNSGQIAADVRLSVEFDDKVLRLERLEPALEQKRDKVQLGNLRPGERKTVAFYFDPQICTRSFFNATVGWEDAGGAFHSTAMRTRAAEVVCPAFSSPRHANTAMLKRMLTEELSFRDSKYFRFPAQTSAEQVFQSCKEAILAQDIRLVKEFVTERPYRAEAWFFGETMIKHSPMVIWTAVFGHERVAQFSAASNAQASITGLLAELGRRLVDSRAGGGVGAPIENLAKAAAAAQVGDRATLLSKSTSAEADTE